MKAFKVRYSGRGFSGGQEIVLVENEADIEKALEEKSFRDFEVGDSYSKIHSSTEIPLSKVKLADLSVAEFLQLTKG